MPSTTELSYELIDNGLYKAELPDDHIVCYQIQESDAAFGQSFTLWYRTVLETMQEWDKSQPYKELHDFSMVPFSPVLERKVQDLVNQLPEGIRGRSALVIARSSGGLALRAAARNLNARVHQQIEQQSFYTTEAALKWLRETD